MTVDDAVSILRKHNEWRRGGDGEPTDPQSLGNAIDVLCHVAKEGEPPGYRIVPDDHSEDVLDMVPAQGAVPVDVDALFNHIAHGDEEHRAWLKRELHAWFSKPAQGAVPVEDWRKQASAWLIREAEEQERTNRDCPLHVKAYPEWEDRPRRLRMMADRVLTASHPSPPADGMPEGFALVPVQPTPAMVDAGANEVSDYYDDGNDQRHREIARFGYKAMLAASREGR